MGDGRATDKKKYGFVVKQKLYFEQKKTFLYHIDKIGNFTILSTFYVLYLYSKVSIYCCSPILVPFNSTTNRLGLSLR